MTDLALWPVTELRTDGCLYRIRLAEPKDRAKIVSNVDKVIAEGSFLIVQQFTLTDDWKACLSHGLDRKNRRALAVATTAGEVVGHCRLFPVWGGSYTAHVGDIGFLVLSDHRNVGLGSALVSSILSWANELSYQKITLCTASENVPALRLAEKFGFVEEGRRVRQYFVQGKYDDEVLMARFLAVESEDITSARQLL
jgi:RimJ/RimL family protein N-acetyltransferase